MKTLFEKSINVCGGVLESRMVARKETEGRDLTDEETLNECRYLLNTIDYAGYDREDTSKIKMACRYIIRSAKST